jgi:DNA primase
VIVPKSDTKRLLGQATSQYQTALQNDGEASTYLVEERGITSEALDYFRIGIVRNPFPGHEMYVGRLAFPYITPSGIVSIRFRTLGPPGERSKFLSITGDDTRLYNTTALTLGTKEIYICEGETDTIAAHQCGLPAVGIPGAKTWVKNARVFGRVFANRTVFVLADNDDSGEGQELAQDIYRTLGGSTAVLMPKGYDVSKLVAAKGADDLQRLVSNAIR